MKINLVWWAIDHNKNKKFSSVVHYTSSQVYDLGDKRNEPPPAFPYKMPIFKRYLPTTIAWEELGNFLDGTIWQENSHNWALGYRNHSRVLSAKVLGGSQKKGAKTANLYGIFALQPDWPGFTHLLPVVGKVKTGKFIC